MDEPLALQALRLLFPAGIGALSTVTIIVILVLIFPEKVELWQSILWGWVENIGFLYKRANKEKIKHGIQGRVASFARELGSSLPEFDPPNVKIQWVEQNGRKAFIDSGTAVIRLRREEPNNENIVTACMVFVSQILLRKSGRHLSSTQRSAVELFVGYKMLESEKAEVFDTFIDKWLYPGIENNNIKTNEYFGRFHTIDEAELFLPVFLQELIYMGEKVFSRPRDDTIMKEVDGSLEFLEMHASRKLGEDVDRPYFSGEACCFAIMIIGRAYNVDDERYYVYTNHIQNILIPCDVETIYMIGPEKNASFMRDIAKMVNEDFANPFSCNYDVALLAKDGERVSAINHLSVLRSIRRVRYVS